MEQKREQIIAKRLMFWSQAVDQESHIDEGLLCKQTLAFTNHIEGGEQLGSP